MTREQTYQRRSEPSSGEYRRSLWDAAFGLQAVDGLAPSTYVRSLAAENVAGRMTLDEVGRDLDAYHRRERELAGVVTPEEEADRVSHRIVELLEDGSFTLDPQMLSVIHRHLFQGIDDAHYGPGEYKEVQLVKCERILNGDSVLYGPPSLYKRSLEVLFAREAGHAYESYADGPLLSWSDTEMLARFIADVWMVHPFLEGNTRTVAVFLELYLRWMGFDVDNGPFERHASFFRGALVRACYQNRSIGVKLELEPLMAFLTKLVEDPSASLNYDSLWCIPLFAHPDRVRNVSLVDAEPIRQALATEGITACLVG